MEITIGESDCPAQFEALFDEDICVRIRDGNGEPGWSLLGGGGSVACIVHIPLEHRHGKGLFAANHGLF